ncbi:MAG: PTS sugar transporter subunit IIA, partial [Chloroflexota bacterium]|nr:PTS sugar transporter subunit IIA [Chloroflexota bacterium]
MIGIVLISHGNLAEGLLDAAKMITGEPENIACIGLQPADDIDQLVERIQEAVNQVDDQDGVLLLVDLFGASPFNASGRLVLAQKDRLRLVTGMNLPMLVELLVAREGLDLDTA